MRLWCGSLFRCSSPRLVGSGGEDEFRDSKKHDFKSSTATLLAPQSAQASHGTMWKSAAVTLSRARTIFSPNRRVKNVAGANVQWQHAR